MSQVFKFFLIFFKWKLSTLSPHFDFTILLMVWRRKRKRMKLRWKQFFSSYWLVLMASLEAEERNVYYQKKRGNEHRRLSKVIAKFSPLGEEVDFPRHLAMSLWRNSQNWKFAFSLRMHKTQWNAFSPPPPPPPFTPHPMKKSPCKHWKIENSPRETVGFYFNWKQFRLVLLWLDVCSLRFLSILFGPNVSL